MMAFLALCTLKDLHTLNQVDTPTSQKQKQLLDTLLQYTAFWSREREVKFRPKTATPQVLGQRPAVQNVTGEGVKRLLGGEQ